MRYIHRLYIIYILILMFVIYLKPSIMFSDDGSLKDFGITKGKTIFPLWVFVILLAILIYFGYIILLNILHKYINE